MKQRVCGAGYPLTYLRRCLPEAILLVAAKSRAVLPRGSVDPGNSSPSDALFCADVFCSDRLKQFFKFWDLFVGPWFHAQQYSAATKSGFVDFCAILWNSCSDESTNHSAGGAACSCSSQRRGNGSGNDQVDAGKENRAAHSGDCGQHSSDRATYCAADSGSIRRMRSGLQSELLIARCVRHHHADVVPSVTTLDDRVDGGLGRQAVLEKACN